MNENKIFWLGCLLSRGILLLFLFTSRVGLMPDEAQYWTWSLFPDFGYYSKPPGIAWQIFLGTFLFGTNEFGVRIFSILLPIPMALLIKQIVYLLTSNKQIGYLTGLAFLLSPLGMSASLLATTDGGMLLFGLLAIYAYLKNTNSFQTGIFIALGACWKWMSFALLLPILLYECIIKQFHFRSFTKLCFFSLLGLLPSLLWNMQHDFATFRHVGGTLFNTHSSHAGANPLSFLLAGIFLLSPGFFLMALPPLFSIRKDKKLLLQLIVFVIFGCVFVASFFRKVQGNWAVLGQVFLFPLMGFFLATTTKKWILPVSIALSLALQAFFLAAPYTSLLEKSPLRHGMGLEQIPNALFLSGYTQNNFLFSDRYQTVSQVWFYGPNKKKVYFFNVSSLRKNQFCFWPGMKEECLHKNGFFVALIPSSEKHSLSSRIHHLQKRLEPYFSRIGKAKIYPLLSHNYLLVIPAYGYLGTTPEEIKKY